MLDALLNGASLKDAADQAVKKGFKRNDVYKARLAIAELFENGDEE